METLGPYEPNTIVMGDCLDVMRQMPDGCVDLVVTDPPYPNGLDLWEDSWETTYAALAECGRVAKDFISFMWGPFRAPVPPDGWYHISAHVWEKPNTPFIHRRFEHIHTWGREAKARACYVWRVPIINYKTLPEWCPHPTQKPLKLMALWLEWLGKMSKGDLILDPFMGSGTTAVAADRLGRRWFGCDISPEYVKMALERIEQDRLQRSQLRLGLGGSGGDEQVAT